MDNIWGKSVKSTSEIKTALDEGFGWVSLPVGAIMEMSENRFKSFQDTVEKTGIEFRVCSLSLPQDVVISQKGFNTYMWTEYAKHAMIRMLELGCKFVKWTGRSAVELPEEGDVTEAREQILQYLYLLRGYAGKYGIKLLIEPSGREEFDYFDSIENSHPLFSAVPGGDIGISIDADSLSSDSFKLDNMEDFGDLLSLVELKDGKGERKKELYGAFFSMLKSVNFNGLFLLSDESGTSDLDYYKSLWEV